MKFNIPTNQKLTKEFFDFLLEVNGSPPSPDLPPSIMLGHEEKHNHNILYLKRKDKRIAGTCLTTISKAVPSLAGFGAVATHPDFRRSGISTNLCGQAVDEFQNSGGKAFFLGTHNPNAARVYHRLGWRKLSGANVMANISNNDSPEGFLTDYFRKPSPFNIRSASNADRIPMIPLLLSPHDWQVLDANTEIYSTRYRVQNSCMGLYPKYSTLTEKQRGTWFSAVSNDGRLLGIATVLLIDGITCQIDGFAHKYHQTCWKPLMQTAMDWAGKKGASLWRATVSIEDEEKQALFESLGFSKSNKGTNFDLDDREVEGILLQRT